MKLRAIIGDIAVTTCAVGSILLFMVEHYWQSFVFAFVASAYLVIDEVASR